MFATPCHFDRVLDLSFIGKEVNELYCEDNGRPSVPPELITRMVLLEYLYSLSVVRLCEEITMHAGFRWFCRLLYGATEPNRRALVKQRKRWAEAGVFEKILRKDSNASMLAW